MTGGGAESCPDILKIDRTSLPQGYAALAIENGLDVVSCGRPRRSHRVAIVDPASELRVADRHVGEIWVYGQSVAKGYDAETTQVPETFGASLDGEAGWLRTGDAGFLSGGELYVTDRLKETIIIRGENHSPSDIESTAVGAHVSLQPGGLPAFMVEEETSQLILVAEVAQKYRRYNSQEVVCAIRDGVTSALGLRLHDILLVRPGTVPRTTSEKVQRTRCRDLFVAKALEARQI